MGWQAAKLRRLLLQLARDGTTIVVVKSRLCGLDAVGRAAAFLDSH
jgi:hypothetical protein